MAVKKQTPFELAQQQVADGTLTPPTISYGSKPIDYFGYQLAVHHHNLKILAFGMTMRGVKLKDLKAYYGLKGKSAKDCLVEFEVINDAYKAKYSAAKA